MYRTLVLDAVRLGQILKVDDEVLITVVVPDYRATEGLASFATPCYRGLTLVRNT